MKKRCLVLLVLALSMGEGFARAEWVRLPGAMPESDITFVVVHPRDSRILYVAGERNVYRSKDSGSEWKRVLSVRGEANRVRFMSVDELNLDTLYVATDKGVQKSQDSGKSWKTIYRGTGSKAKTVHWIAEDRAEIGKLWLGTGHGLVKLSKDGAQARRVASLPDLRVYSIWTSGSGRDVFLSSDKGIYRSVDAGEHWERVLADRESRPEGQEGVPLSQFQIEELSTQALFSNFAYATSQNRLITASPKGIFESDGRGADWKRAAGDDLPEKKVNHLTASSDSFYAATDQGAFQWDHEKNILKDISDGLPSKEIRMMSYHATSGDLFAATKKGIFRYPKPEFKEMAPAVLAPKPDVREILGRFRHEPTILEVQLAAIRYAEVHPDKIKAWREAAMKKAWLPTLSVTADSNKDQNVDLDRGGTNDPDRFIVGPAEESTDFHAGISWDLGDLVWNDDQTSIDTRSKLMVELRDDLMNEVTHLYFERRRLQVDILMVPPKELPLQIEKELKLQELTAGIDALTGGFFSARLEETEPALPKR